MKDLCVVIFILPIIIIIVIIIIIIITTFMQVIYNYMPETNHIYSVAAVLYLQFVLHVMLFRMLNTFSTFTLALSAVRVQCPIWPFSVVPYFRAFPVRCSGIVRMILKWFQLPLLVLTSFWFFTFNMR
jgi:hypothetical protein